MLSANPTPRNPRRLKRLLLVSTLIGLGLIGVTQVLRRTGSPAGSEDKLTNVTYMEIDEYLLSEGNRFRRSDGSIDLCKVLLPIVPPPQPLPPPDQGGYLGPTVCAECHQDYFEGYQHTSHFHTSAIASRATVKGSFAPGENELTTACPNLKFHMLDVNGKLIQRVLLTSGRDTYAEDFPFGLATGSGKVGQTYLYWNEDHLYQMHVSYVESLGRWANSPGFIDGTADYARPILPLCLECHTTYAQAIPGTINQYRPDTMVLGVTCEKCHGPGEKHVEFHRQQEDAEPHHITNPANLPPERSMEICQLCHGGLPQEMIQPPFHFRPGQPLENFYRFDYNAEPAGIHSNSQLPRLRMSRCFTQSDAMTCVDCHDPHAFERGDLALFSARCMNCHAAQDCGLHDTVPPASLTSNCIDCHMPAREMEDIVIMTGSDAKNPPMRDHFIRVWPEVSREILEAWKLPAASTAR
ncbi:MAG: hypothetical protein D6753_00960 [Planctomycetota bacterium]|nr:MAG: hypothetical protein D6753_00960 [Planctomycetota bacterium]